MSLVWSFSPPPRSRVFAVYSPAVQVYRRIASEAAPPPNARKNTSPLFSSGGVRGSEFPLFLWRSLFFFFSPVLFFSVSTPPPRRVRNGATQPIVSVFSRLCCCSFGFSTFPSFSLCFSLAVVLCRAGLCTVLGSVYVYKYARLLARAFFVREGDEANGHLHTR